MAEVFEVHDLQAVARLAAIQVIDDVVAVSTVDCARKAARYARAACSVT